jgi:hypothetical protein
MATNFVDGRALFLKKKKKIVGWLGRALSILLVGEGTMPANGTIFVCGRDHNACKEEK